MISGVVSGSAVGRKTGAKALRTIINANPIINSVRIWPGKKLKWFGSSSGSELQFRHTAHANEGDVDGH